MAQRDVEIDFMSRAYKNLTEQISEKLFFNAALGNVLSLFTHNAHRQHGRSCACVGNDKYRKRWAPVLMLRSPYHVTLHDGGRSGNSKRVEIDFMHWWNCGKKRLHIKTKMVSMSRSNKCLANYLSPCF